MKVKDIVKLCGTLLQYDFEQNLFEENADTDLVRQALVADKKLSLLTECVDIVQKELACDYFPLIFVQTFDSNSVAFCDFTNPPHEILSVVDNFGCEVNIAFYPTQIVAETEGKITIKYSYRPNKKSFNQELECGSPKIDERLFAYGVLSEYMFLTAMYDEAAIWDKRYKDLIQIATYQNKPQKVKCRRWA